MQRREFLLAATAGCLARSGYAMGRAGQQAVGVPWLNEVQTPPRAYGPETRELGGKLSPLVPDGATRQDWDRRRSELRAWWKEFLGLWDRPSEAPTFEVLDEDRESGVQRQRIRYLVEPGVSTEAYLLRPLRRSQMCPGYAVFHSTVPHSIRQPAGVQGVPEKAFGLQLARSGSVALCPRNFLWPENDRIEAEAETRRFHQRRPNAKGMARMLNDALIAVDLLASLEDVDVQRIGAVGHSLGAKEVLYLAAFDQRVKVAASSEGGVGITFSNWNAPWYLGEPVANSEFQHDHHELLALVAPRAFLLVGGDSADGARSWPYLAAASPAYEVYRADEPAAWGLLRHEHGHSVPPEANARILEWLAAWWS